MNVPYPVFKEPRDPSLPTGGDYSMRYGQAVTTLALRADAMTRARTKAADIKLTGLLGAPEGFYVFDELPEFIEFVDAELVTLPNTRLVGIARSASVFDALANRWIEETAFESSPVRIFSHPAYLEILAMGPAAIPHLLRRLGVEPERWAGTLKLITREPVADRATTSQEAIDAWVEWGRRHGYAV